MDEIPARPKRNHEKYHKKKTNHKGQASESNSSKAKTTLITGPTHDNTSEIKNPTEGSEESDREFSKRKVLSNWTKYTENDSSHDIEEPAADFEQLLLAPSSNGGHFLFNSEKNWEGSDDWYDRDEYFQLNLVELTQSLATIPFYERQNYSKDVFSSEEIEEMERKAGYQLFKWQENSKTVPTLSPGSIKSKYEIKESPAPPIIVPKNDEDDLDELLNLPGTETSFSERQKNYDFPSNSTSSLTVTAQSANHTSSLDSTDDIQKWLDDVLVLDS